MADRVKQSIFSLMLLSLAWLTGCAQIPLGDPAPSFENIEKARASRTAPVAVGTFRITPGLNPEIDKGVSVRSHMLSSPVEGSFAQYLKQTLIANLKASGLYDASSKAVISGFLTDSMLDVPMDTGHASLGARFVLERTGKTVYDKELKASVSWPSSFIGAEAIPAGINQYGSLYQKLIGKLLDDPDFQIANPGKQE